ncbi:MAG: response regulator [Thermodesulfobacteriota bacterium]
MESARILIVEDDYVVARDLRGRLEKMGYMVCGHASDGEQAVELSRKDPPDLILMDIHLGRGMDGIQAAAEITGRRSLPVVFLSAYGDEECFGRAKLTEPYGYILKPFGDRELKVSLDLALYKSRLEEDRRRFAAEREHLIAQLQEALAEVKTLRGLLPICSVCKKIRDDSGLWQRIEKYIQDRSEVLFSHSICPDCARELYPELYGEKKE